MAHNDDDTTPLLNADASEIVATRRAAAGSILTVVVIAALITLIAVLGADDIDLESHWLLRGSPHQAARRILSKYPVIDGHIDLPEVARTVYSNNLTAIPLDKTTFGQVDIPRLRQGHVGAFFWSVYVDCKQENENFTQPSYRVRDTLEQIDIAKGLIDMFSNTFQLVSTALEAKEAMRSRKIAGWLGVEGGHQLGNSLSVLRQYYALGVRYMTLTHACHNAFADSGGMLKPLPPLHHGLSDFGVELVKEMNRLGMLVDLSHTSDDTVRHTLNVTRAPVIWSHSSARALHDVARNVPDDILKRIGFPHGEKSKIDAVVMVNFAPYFVANPGKADVKIVADHIEHIARIAGKKHVGIGSDFDGIEITPRGLEDVSKYPNLFAELISRKSGWDVTSLAGLAGGNLLRVMEGAEQVARKMKKSGIKSSWQLWEGRDDLPVRDKWPGVVGQDVQA